MSKYHIRYRILNEPERTAIIESELSRNQTIISILGGTNGLEQLRMVGTDEPVNMQDCESIKIVEI